VPMGGPFGDKKGEDRRGAHRSEKRSDRTKKTGVLRNEKNKEVRLLASNAVFFPLILISAEKKIRQSSVLAWIGIMLKKLGA